MYVDFDSGASSFTSNFTVYNNGGANNTSLAWGGAFGVNDQTGGTAGGGVQSSGSVAIDTTAVYTPSKVNLSDGLVHTLSEYVSAVTGLGTGDKSLQLGYLSPTSTGFNTGFSFISARILGNDTVEFQSANGAGAVSTNNTAPTGTISAGDWLDLIFTAQETASGSFKGTFSLVDYGPTGIGPGTTVLAPVSYSVTGLTGLGTASAVSPGWRTATSAAFTGHVRFDNFAVDPPGPAKLAYLQQPSTGTSATPMGPFVVAVEDIAGHTVSTDSSTVTLTLSHDTFANGATSMSAAAVNGVATFSNLVINVPGSYVLRATDTNPNLDPGYAPFTITSGTATKLAFVQQPTSTTAGATITPAVTVAVEDAGGNTVTSDTSIVTLTLSSGTFAGGSSTVSVAAVNGVATFSNLVINSAGTYTLAAGDGSLTGATSNSFTITNPSSFLDNFNSGATTFTSNFKVYNNGGANNTSLAWGSTFGVKDQAGGSAGGGVETTSSVTIDSTAVYTAATVNLSDGLVHTLSEYVTAIPLLGTGNKPLQLGYLSPASTGFNTGFSFISARILGNRSVEFQYANGAGAVSSHNTLPTGTINTGDWLKLIFTAQETASGSFKGTFSLVDYGPTGVGTPTTVLAPVSYSVSGLTGLGTAPAVAPGFRTALPSTFTGHLQLDNFADPATRPRGGRPVSLAGFYNQVGIVRDGSTFRGGLDGKGFALSGSLLGTRLIWKGKHYLLGAPGGNNVVAAAGQTIRLPAGSFSTLSFLATAVNANQPGQQFVVTYTDGTTQTFRQGISTWFTSHQYIGESDVLDMGYRNTSNGTRDRRTFHVHGYSLHLRAGKTVKSITLPDDGRVKILAIELS